MKLKPILPILFLLTGSLAYALPPSLKAVRLGSYKDHTRLVFEVNDRVKFRLEPNIEKSSLQLNLRGVGLEPLVDKIFADKRISLNISSLKESGVVADIKLKGTPKGAPMSFYYFTLYDPYRIVIDFKDMKLFPRSTKRDALVKAAKKDEPKKEIEQKREELKEETTLDIPPVSEEDLALKNLYIKGMRHLNRGEFEESSVVLQDFMRHYPRHRYSAVAAYMIAEDYRLLSVDDETKINRALDAYRVAISKYQKNFRRQLALYRMAGLYARQNLNVEAKGTYQALIKDYPKGKYAPSSILARSEIFMKERRFLAAYNELEKILFMYPDSAEVREATYKIAHSYFHDKNYTKALEIYDKSIKKWPGYLKTNPENLFNVAETFYLRDRPEGAKKNLFILINMYPKSFYAPKALVRLGDIYREKGEKSNALKLYSAAITEYSGDDVVIGKVRMADMGIEDGTLLKGKIFNYNPYEYPKGTYVEAINKYKTGEVADTALLGMGKIFLKDREHMLALDKFKELLANDPNMDLQKKGKEEMRKIFFRLVNSYHSQDGFFPVLILYYKNFETFFAEIKDPGILSEIGDSYFQLGFYDKAVDIYSFVKLNDKHKKYDRAILLGTGKVHYCQERYKESESIFRSFLKRYPTGKGSILARKLLGDSLFRRNKFRKAYMVYADFIKRMSEGEMAVQVYKSMADSEYMLGRYTKSAYIYKQAIKEAKRLRPTDENKELIRRLNFHLFYATFKGKRFKDAVKMAESLQKAYPVDEKVPLVLYLEAESYRAMKNEVKSKEILTRLEEKEDKFIATIASSEIDYMDWKNKHIDLFRAGNSKTSKM